MAKKTNKKDAVKTISESPQQDDSADNKDSEKENLPANVIKTNITEEMQKAYLDYAMSVIVSRALPDVRDGLKPVHRRIIYAMQDQNMTVDTKFHKCAAVVGEVLKKYHPHGDTAVYDSIVRMGQDFSLRYPLIFPQGNFGSIDGDPPAAMRYTECKMTKITEELYRDIDKDTVNFELNDLQNYEPVYLPALLPNLLLNGATGIAVGMATNIPPHHLGEIIDGINLLIEKAETIGTAPKKKNTDTAPQVTQIDFSSSATVEDLIQVIKGPDFPTGGIIYNQKEITQMYATGKGRIVTRAKTTIEESKKGRARIVVTEIPYQVNKSTLVTKIANQIKNKKIKGVSDLRDESNRDGLRIVVELKKSAVPKKVQNRLYKYTPLQTTFNANIVALLDNEPKLMTLKMILEEFIKHRQQVIVKRTLFLLRKAQEREHILLGLKIALDNLDAVINLIRNSKDAQTAKTGLMKEFDLSEIQAQAILDMQLRKLAALERQKIEDELKEIMETIKDFESLLASPQKIIDTVKEELTEIKETYNDERRTKVIKGKAGKISEEDLVVSEPCLITISNSGYIKRLKESTYKKQGRGGKGVRGQTLKEEDELHTIKTCNTHDYAFFFTNTGKVYKMRIWEIPETSRNSKGTALVNFLSISQEENVQAFLAMSSEKLESKKGFVVFSTEKGYSKKTSMDQFENIRSSGIMAINLKEGDALVSAKLSSGKNEIMLITARGQSIRFSEKDVRSMGRNARGVIGIKLIKPDDLVIGMVVVPEDPEGCNLVVATEKGYGKKTKLTEYKTQKRGGSGIRTYKVSQKTGNLIAAKLQHTNTKSDLLIATTSGQVIRLPKKQISTLGRDTMGVRLIKLSKGDRAVSATFLENEIDETPSIES